MSFFSGFQIHLKLSLNKLTNEIKVEPKIKMELEIDFEIEMKMKMEIFPSILSA